MKQTNHDPQLPFDGATTPPPSEGRRRRDKAMKKVESHAAPGFLDGALVAAGRAARDLPHLTSDDLWRYMPPEVTTPDNRAMGPVMVRAKKLGLIEPTDRFKPTIFPRGHAGPRRVWRSLVWGK